MRNFLAVFLGLLIGNIVIVRFLGGDLNTALERSFFQGVALILYVFINRKR